METLRKTLDKTFHPIYMDNWLKEFEELLLEWQTMHDIIEKHIEESLEITCVDEEAYLNELVAYQLHFETYQYDQLTNKLVEVLVNVFQKSSFV